MKSNGAIDFLYRTVADFLRTREMSTFLDRNTADDFSPNLAILKAYTVCVKTEAFIAPSNLRCYGLVEEALIYTARAESDCQLVQKSHLDEAIDNVGHAMLTRVLLRSIQSSTLEARESDAMQLFRQCVLYLPGLTPYLSRKLLKDPGYLSCFPEPSILVVLQLPPPTSTSWLPEAPKRLASVLNSGCCPNQFIPGTEDTIWSSLLSDWLPWCD